MPVVNLAYDRDNNDNNSDYNLNKYRRLSNEEEVADSLTGGHENITIKTKNADRSHAMKIIGIAVTALVLLFCVVYGKVQISDMYSKINNQKSLLTVAQSENARLKAELEAYTSLRNVEEYAETIGLKKLDKAQIWYVDIQNEDVVKIPESEDNLFVQIKKSILSVLDNFECMID